MMKINKTIHKRLHKTFIVFFSGLVSLGDVTLLSAGAGQSAKMGYKSRECMHDILIRTYVQAPINKPHPNKYSQATPRPGPAWYAQKLGAAWT